MISYKAYPEHAVDKYMLICEIYNEVYSIVSGLLILIESNFKISAIRSKIVFNF